MRPFLICKLLFFRNSNKHFCVNQSKFANSCSMGRWWFTHARNVIDMYKNNIVYINNGECQIECQIECQLNVKYVES